MARPTKWTKIDKEQLEKCAEKHWTIEEIAAFFRVSPMTIKRHFGPFIDECKQRGKTKLRDLQWKRALEGSDRMILHMSQHYLDQSEKQEKIIIQKNSDLTDDEIAAEIKRLKTIRTNQRASDTSSEE